jgi:hypothetical protein
MNATCVANKGHAHDGWDPAASAPWVLGLVPVDIADHGAAAGGGAAMYASHC